MTSKKPEYPHPYIPELVENLRQKKIDRREFLRTSTLLGLSATAAYGIAGQLTGQGLMDYWKKEREIHKNMLIKMGAISG